MNRRDFLKLMLATAAAEAVDFDKLLWVPKPIVTVPRRLVTGTVGGMDSAMFNFFRNTQGNIYISQPVMLKRLMDIVGVDESALL